MPAPDSGSTDWDPDRYVVYRIAAMGPGTVDVRDRERRGRESISLCCLAKNKQGAEADLLFAQYHGDTTYYSQNGLYLVGLPMPITLVLTDFQGPDSRRGCHCDDRHPDKDPVVLRLRDDGGSYDGTAGDGVYSAAYTPTTEGSPSGGQPAKRHHLIWQAVTMSGPTLSGPTTSVANS